MSRIIMSLVMIGFVTIFTCSPSIVCALDKDTELREAASRGDTQKIKHLLNGGASVRAKNHARFTALMEASNNGHLEAVKLLLEKGADVNAQGIWGTTALIEASTNGRLEVVKFLLEKGADVNAQTVRGARALLWLLLMATLKW